MIKRLLAKLWHKLPVLAYDVAVIPLSWYAAYWLRFNMHAMPVKLHSLVSIKALMLLSLVQITAYYYFKVYRGLWRFASLNDVRRIIQAVSAAVIFVVPLLYWFSFLHGIPRSVLPLYALIQVTFLCSGRMVVRSYYDGVGRRSKHDGSKRVLIIGAGFAGESLVRDLIRSKQYWPIGFVDDNPAKRGHEVHGIRVLGTTRDLADLIHRYEVNLVFIAIPSARSMTMRRLVSSCEKTGVSFRTLPDISALVAGRVTVNALRPVKLEDLLGRDQVSLEWDKIANTVQNRTVVVTGGGGSIGSELCRQILALNPGKLIVIDNCEYNLYQIEREFETNFPEIAKSFYLLSVTDSVGINQLLQKERPQLILHAAAYKHVPLLEHQIRVAVFNNVIGTQIMAEAAMAANVEKFILISSDKAVNPTNVMGTTKRVAEIYCQNLNLYSSTQFITVRFGNVLGSAGSVVPLFQQQLEAGGPLTVTDPEIERYFMTIPEACQLILQAMVNGTGGEIFVLDMGEPVKIRYLAEQMIRLAGKEPGKDIMIEYTGLRPGEKLYEELFHESEQLTATAHIKLFKARFRELDWHELIQTLRLLEQACQTHQNEELYVLLKSLVPEFQMSGQVLSVN